MVVRDDINFYHTPANVQLLRNFVHYSEEEVPVQSSLVSFVVW